MVYLQHPLLHKFHKKCRRSYSFVESIVAKRLPKLKRCSNNITDSKHPRSVAVITTTTTEIVHGKMGRSLQHSMFVESTVIYQQLLSSFDSTRPRVVVPRRFPYVDGSGTYDRRCNFGTTVPSFLLRAAMLSWQLVGNVGRGKTPCPFWIPCPCRHGPL